ncbi:MAG: DUF4260 domain-containing protein [Rhizobiaceae bacterium]|nr:DUF4260 domain-containing protein [Rhizobiaceae bacterium]
MTGARSVSLILKAEWAAVFVASIFAYWLIGGSWLLFAVLLLAPDLAMLGYLAGNRVGALAYNATHLLIWPVLLFCVGMLAVGGVWTELAIIWLAHIAMDRALGYGLKYATGFADTHLGRIGRQPAIGAGPGDAGRPNP